MINKKCILKYCKNYTEIENYELALKSDELYECHHRLETHNSDGERRMVELSRTELIALGMYYDRPPEELIFLSNFDHNSLHHKGKTSYKGFKHSDETKKKISEVHKGKIPWNKGKKNTEETRKKISEALKGKKNTRIKNTHWFNNGVICVRCFECPEGFVPGM